MRRCKMNKKIHQQMLPTFIVPVKRMLDYIVPIKGLPLCFILLFVFGISFTIGFVISFHPSHNNNINFNCNNKNCLLLPTPSTFTVIDRAHQNYEKLFNSIDTNTAVTTRKAFAVVMYSMVDSNSHAEQLILSSATNSEVDVGTDDNRHVLLDNRTEQNVTTTTNTTVSNISVSANTAIASHNFISTDTLPVNHARNQITMSFKDQIQKCKQAVNIVDVIESYQLPQFQRTSIDRAMALCPFHDDHHPSLHIDATKQIYKCFSCNAGGDVLHFVQEYSKLPAWKPKDELSFLQALHHVNHKFGDGSIRLQSNYPIDPNTIVLNAEMLRKKERIVLANAYAALYYTNCITEPYAGGARYYLRSLRGLSIPVFKTMMIGYAPDVYYDQRFNTNNKNKKNGLRLESPTSLVNHLIQSGFTTQEILDAGLAVIVKNRTTSSTEQINTKPRNNAIRSFDQNETSIIMTRETVNNVLHPTNLMDRFRDRIMVPILDDSGDNVIGFGGRIIPPPDPNEIQQSTVYKAAKYLNSPESLVFEKRKILFNHHLAQKVIHNKSKNRNDPTPSLLVVEGYMDVISLWEIGIHHVVASMGTAISVEQLDQASKISGTRGGKIILCLDNDSAGRDAIERLCRNGMLTECITKNIVSVHVALLPPNTKDPSDFVENRRNLGRSAKEIADDFRNEVIDTSIDWTEWYIQHIINGYNKDAPRGTPGSFSYVFERIADFLANTFNPADRTKRAYEVAGQLATILAVEGNSTQISMSVRIQLESDLIDLAAQLSAKEVMRRRILKPTTTIITDPSTVTSTSEIAPFTQSQGLLSRVDEYSKLSKNATRMKSTQSKLINQQKNKSLQLTKNLKKETTPRGPSSSTKSTDSYAKSTRATIRRKREPNFVSVTAHFSGFQFNHQSDMDWLGLQNNKYKKAKTDALVLGQRYQASGNGVNGETTVESGKHIYFNSAGFNGYQFLSDSAINAGYTLAGNSFKPDASLLELGLASIVEQDIRSMITSAENALLKILVTDKAARLVVKNMMVARQAVNYDEDIQWSSPEKKWLFEVLTYRLEHHTDISNANEKELRFYLATLPDSPPGAFSLDTGIDEYASQHAFLIRTESPNSDAILEKADDLNAIEVPLVTHNIRSSTLSVQNLQVSAGTLELFFVDNTSALSEKDDHEIIGGTRNELSVQEAMVSLLWASTALKSKLIQEELAMRYPVPATTASILQRHKSLAESLEHQELGSNAIQTLQKSNIVTEFPVEDEIQVDTYQSELLIKLRDTTHTLLTLKESLNRIELRLLDESTSTGIEGSISRTLQHDLALQLDDHVRNVFQHNLCPKPGINDLPYEEELEKMAKEWGDWFDDDYMWTPGESAKVESKNQIVVSRIDSIDSNIEKETLEEFFERINREWSEWDL